MRRFLISAAILLLAPIAAMAGETAPELNGDLARLQGQWTGKVGPDENIPVTLTFEGHAITVRVARPGADAIDLKGEFTIDETAKPHKSIDWVKFTGPGGNAMPDNKGIYVFEDADTLKVCSAGDDHIRPTEFAPRPGDGRSSPSTAILKREKKLAQGKSDSPRSVAVDDAKDKAKNAPKGDLARLQGTWTAKAGPEKNIPIAITIKGNSVSLKITTPAGDDFTTDGEVKIDENARPHKTIDWVNFTSPNGDPLPENLGLYEFVDADTLRVCGAGPGNPRPTEFKAGEGGPPNLVTLTRMPAEK